MDQAVTEKITLHVDLQLGVTVLSGHQSCAFKTCYVAGADLAEERAAQTKQCVPLRHNILFFALETDAFLHSESLQTAGRATAPTDILQSSRFADHHAFTTGRASPRTCFGWWVVDNTTCLVNIYSLSCGCAFSSSELKGSFHLQLTGGDVSLQVLAEPG